MAGFALHHDGMTEETNTVTVPRRLTGPLAADDPRFVFAKAVALAGAVIDGVPGDKLEAPTPCSEFDVRGLLGHLVGVLRRVAVVGRGEDPMSAPFVVENVDDGAWLDAWTAAAHDVQAAWADDAVLDRDLRLPWTTMTGRSALAIYTSEVTVHTWDLATATGQRPVWDDEVVATAYGILREQLPADGREPELPFAPVVDTPEDAPLIDRLVAWSGRRPLPA